MTNLIALLLLTTSPAQADIGPKPSAYFEWQSRSELDLASVRLLQCKDPQCKESSRLEPIGPQHFSCCSLGCFAVAYGFSEPSQLSAVIGGREVKSEPFTIASPNGYFEVSAGPGHLYVRAIGSMPNEKMEMLENCRR